MDKIKRTELFVAISTLNKAEELLKKAEIGKIRLSGKGTSTDNLISAFRDAMNILSVKKLTLEIPEDVLAYYESNKFWSDSKDEPKDEPKPVEKKERTFNLDQPAGLCNFMIQESKWTLAQIFDKVSKMALSQGKKSFTKSKSEIKGHFNWLRKQWGWTITEQKNGIIKTKI